MLFLLLAAIPGGVPAMKEGTPPPCPQFGPVAEVGQLGSPSFDEISGLAASRRNPGIYWAHNDHAGENILFALTTGGQWRGTWILHGAEAVDWEDIAVGPGPDPGRHYVYIADTGDNNLNRTELTIHRVAEPEAPVDGPGTIAILHDVESVTFRLEGGVAHDGEAFMVDPLTGQMVMVTRDRRGSGFAEVYRLPAFDEVPPGVATAAHVASIPMIGHPVVKGGDISPDGREILLVLHANSTGDTEVHVHLRTSPPGGDFTFGQSPCRIVPHPSTPQTEAIAWSLDGDSFLTTSEGIGEAIYRAVRLGEPPPLFINEFMAANTSTLADNTGAYSPWIEIFNEGSEAVDLGGMFLTGDVLQPRMWAFPEGTILEGGGFLLLWASGREEDSAAGYLHAGFTLSPEGGSIGLFDRDDRNNRLIHGFFYEQQEADISLGLLPDGSGDPRPLEFPTPGRSNTPAEALTQGWVVK